MPKNCANCGAPLPFKEGVIKCSYCGTEYAPEGGIHADFNTDEYTGVLRIGDKDYSVYLSSIDVEFLSLDVGRDISGRLYRGATKPIHTFTMIEM